MGKTVGKVARVVAGAATFGGSELTLAAGKGIKKKLIDEPAQARKEALDIQKKQVADAEARQKEFEETQKNAEIVAEASATQKQNKAKQRTMGAYGRGATIITGAAGVQAPATTATKSLIGA